MALRSHARRVRGGVFSREQLADDLQHLAEEAVSMAQELPPEPAAIASDGPEPEPDDFDAADTVPLGIFAPPPKAKA